MLKASLLAGTQSAIYVYGCSDPHGETPRFNDVVSDVSDSAAGLLHNLSSKGCMIDVVFGAFLTFLSTVITFMSPNALQ